MSRSAASLFNLQWISGNNLDPGALGSTGKSKNIAKPIQSEDQREDQLGLSRPSTARKEVCVF